MADFVVVSGVATHCTSFTNFIVTAVFVISSVIFSAFLIFVINCSVSDFKNLRSFFALVYSACSRSLSSAVGTGGLSSMGGPKGAIMRVTTCRLCLDVRHPLRISTMSPVRSESLGSWTRCFSGFLKNYFGRWRHTGKSICQAA